MWRGNCTSNSSRSRLGKLLSFYVYYSGADYVELISYEESMQEGMASDSDRV